MTGLVCVTGTRGAPGASTLAIALAPGHADGAVRSVLIDADPDGGTFAARFGVSAHPGLVELAATTRHGLDALDLDACVQGCSSRFDLLAAPARPDPVAAGLGRLRGLWGTLIGAREAVGDLGRWRPNSPSLDLLDTAVAVVLVVDPTVAGVAHATAAFEDLTARCARVVVAVRGARPYPPAEIGEVLGTDAVVELRTDRVAVTTLTAVTTGRWSRRSVLARDAARISELLHGSDRVAV